MTKEEVLKIEEIVRDNLDTNVKKERPLVPKHLIDLYFRPKIFFMSQINFGKTPYILFVIWIVGISTAIGKLNQKLSKAGLGLTSESSEYLLFITDSWIHFWPIMIALGSISAAFLWTIGGWWYNLRIKWSGANDHDRFTGKVIYIYTSFINAFPSILLVILYNFLFLNYRLAYSADEWYSVILIIFPFWSVVNSYKGVSNVFNIHNFKTKLWFLILPGFLYFLVFGMVAALYLFVE